MAHPTRSTRELQVWDTDNEAWGKGLLGLGPKGNAGRGGGSAENRDGLTAAVSSSRSVSMPL